MEKPVMNPQVSNLEALSALADGELAAYDIAALVQASAGDAKLQAAWQQYHLIGDVLRDVSHGVSHGASVHAPAALHAQPAVTQLVTQPATQTVTHATPMPSTPAANDSVWRWKLVAGFAAVAAVGSVVWSLAGSGSGVGGAGQSQLLASNAAPAVAVAIAPTATANTAAQPEQVMIRDPRLDELLAAHKQFGAASALQPAGFLRNATFQTPQR